MLWRIGILSKLHPVDYRRRSPDWAGSENGVVIEPVSYDQPNVLRMGDLTGRKREEWRWVKNDLRTDGRCLEDSRTICFGEYEDQKDVGTDMAMDNYPTIGMRKTYNIN